MSETEAESEPGADAGTEPPAELDELIAEHPDEVARFLERLDVVNDLLDTADLATAAMDDRMVQELSGTATNLGAAADGLATDEVARLGEATGENADDLADALETLARLQRSGTLDDLVALADLAALASNAMDDGMVTDLAATGTRLGELADTASDEDTVRTLESLLEAVGEASADPPEPVGFRGLVSALRDLNVRRGLGFAIAVARGIGKRLGR
ncbi:hypothetical protein CHINAEXTREME_18420 [Halobiforma lacisalsi AJ5]|uniref:DUF1641 domain-containing protein n=1 Tax=Natronobacterium lacisalsi AJ5 TaxID=358396 RepID=M0LQ42_NATLA|nr:DUF1641 domain-containing protein [Halobiforma lacisalsi]APW99623.1 hypothetical protein CHINAEXTREME_18420 [Halobiforma lacisalsi AJ5]EMA35591.1 hypothetical protein C445_05143 [Halobiforma lacisalsi AJ5]